MFSFLVLTLISTLSFAQSGLPTRTRIEGFFGGSWMCDPISLNDVQRVDCQAVPHYQVIYGSLDDLEPIFSEILFQEAARTGHNQVQCLNTFLNLYSPPVRPSVLDPRNRITLHTPSSYMAQQEYEAAALAASQRVSRPFNQTAWNKFKEIRNNLHGLIQLKAEKESLLSSIRMGGDPGDHSAAETLRSQRQLELQNEIATISDVIKITVAQVPLGTMLNVYSVIMDMASQDSIPSRSTFENTYRDSLLRVREQVRRSVRSYDNALQSDGTYQLDRQYRLALAQGGGVRELIQNGIRDQDLRDKLSCRMRAYYVSGPQTTRILELLALSAVSFGTYSIVSAPLRLIANLGITGATAIQVNYAIRDRCTQPTVASGLGTCDAEAMAAAATHEASMAMCAATVIFSAASSGLEIARFIPH